MNCSISALDSCGILPCGNVTACEQSNALFGQNCPSWQAININTKGNYCVSTGIENSKIGFTLVVLGQKHSKCHGYGLGF